jgi:hypothetical protein
MNKILFNFLIVCVSLTGIQDVLAGKVDHTVEERGMKRTPRTPTKIAKPDNLNNKTHSVAHFFVQERLVPLKKINQVGSILLWRKEDNKVLCKPSRIANSIKVSLGNNTISIENSKNSEFISPFKNRFLKDFSVLSLPHNRIVNEISEIIVTFHE